MDTALTISFLVANPSVGRRKPVSTRIFKPFLLTQAFLLNLFRIWVAELFPWKVSQTASNVGFL